MDATPRILGVDDSLTIRKALEIVLKPAGYALDLAADGAEAISKAKQLKPALILLDFILPDMRGTDVCRQLAADPDTAHIPVVLISAKGAEIRQAYRDIGNVVSYIEKPFKPQAVTGVVAEVLAKGAIGALVKLDTPADAGASESLAAAANDAAQPAAATNDVPADVEALTWSVPGTVNEEVEELDLDEVDAGTDSATDVAARREQLEGMFETLRAAIEGVYVEEVDTPAGAAADQAKTYTDLAEQLSRQLAETLRHARSNARYTLYGDGSIRSLDDSLLDVFRRSCRLLLRAAAAGAVAAEVPANGRRILVACHQGGRVHAHTDALLAAHPDWPAFVIAEGFRQLPMMVRLYGPTDLVVEVTGTGALWEQLRTLQRLPEAKTMRIIAVAEPARFAAAMPSEPEARLGLLTERGITTLCASVSEAEDVLCGAAAATAMSAAASPSLAG